MYLLSIAFGPTVVGFMFKTKESAQKNIDQSTTDPAIEIIDDFGSTARINKTAIHGWILEDLDQSKMARAEQMVHQSRCQNLAAKIATSDPALRTMGSPAVITPHGMSPNGYPR